MNNFSIAWTWRISQTTLSADKENEKEHTDAEVSLRAVQVH